MRRPIEPGETIEPKQGVTALYVKGVEVLDVFKVSRTKASFVTAGASDRVLVRAWLNNVCPTCQKINHLVMSYPAEDVEVEWKPSKI